MHQPDIDGERQSRIPKPDEVMAPESDELTLMAIDSAVNSNLREILRIEMKLTRNRAEQ